MRLPRAETDIGTMRADINSKASREEIQTLHTGLKDFVSKQDLEFIYEKLNSKASFQDINELSIKIEETNLKLNDKINYMKFESFKENVESNFKEIDRDKLTKSEFII